MRRPSPASVPPLPSWAEPENVSKAPSRWGRRFFAGARRDFAGRGRRVGENLMVAGGGLCGGGVEDVMAVGGWIVRRDRDTGEGGPQAAPAQPGHAGSACVGGAAGAARPAARCPGSLPGSLGGKGCPFPALPFLPVCGLTPALQAGPPGGCAKGAEIGAQPPAAEPPLRPKAAETARRAVWAAPLPPPPSRHSPFCKIRL